MPLQTIPQPMPVPILTTRKLGSLRCRRHSSPMAITFTSLSMKAGAAYSSRRYSRIEKPSQPGMIGGATSRPLSNSTGPGTPIPMPITFSARTLQRLRRSRRMSFTRERTTLGPSAISMFSAWWASTVMSGAISATSTLEAPRSMAASTPISEESSNVSGRRPPDETCGPVSSSIPRSISAAVAMLALLRENPDCSASSAREIPDDQNTVSSTVISAGERSSQRTITDPSLCSNMNVRRLTAPFLADSRRRYFG